MRNDYRKYDKFDVRDMEIEEILDMNEYVVLESNIESLLDDIETEIDRIIKLIENGKNEDAYNSLQELSDALF